MFLGTQNRWRYANVILFATVVELNAAVAWERQNITDGFLVWQNGRRCRVVGESGERVWLAATGGTSAANAAASNYDTIEVVNLNLVQNPVLVSSAKTLTRADALNPQIVSGTPTITVPLGGGYSCNFKGAPVFASAGSEVISDIRTTGAANPWGSLMCTGASPATYDVVGVKP